MADYITLSMMAERNLADCKYESALEMFDLAKKAAIKAGDEEYETICGGWVDILKRGKK